eukprot:4747755-Ditylum_brightwellii.AAC.1
MILDRVKKLEQDLEQRLISDHVGINRYDALDQEITQLMLSAEKRCCRRQQGHAWSVKLVNATRKVRYWKQCRLCLINGQVEEDNLIQFGASLNISSEQLQLPQVMKNLHEARKVLKTAQENAACLHNKFLKELAQLYITNKNANVASIIKNIRHREEVRSSFASLRYAAKGKQAGS